MLPNKAKHRSTGNGSNVSSAGTRPDSRHTITFEPALPSNRRYGVANFSVAHADLPSGTTEAWDAPRSSGRTSEIPNGGHFNQRSQSLSSDGSDDLGGLNSPPRSVSSRNRRSMETPQTSPAVYLCSSTFREDLYIQEIHESDLDCSSDENLSVVRPDVYEEAASASDSGQVQLERSPSPAPGDAEARMLAKDLERLECTDDRRSWKERMRQEKRRHRRSSGSIHKRTLSQSIGSDTDDEDLQPQHVEIQEAGSSARRLRRRMTGERTSLLFDDPPQVIPEEPEGSDDLPQLFVPDIAGDVDSDLMHALPYYQRDADSLMELDSDDD